jgi:hypothetical protein
MTITPKMKNANITRAAVARTSIPDQSPLAAALIDPIINSIIKISICISIPPNLSKG